MGFYWVSGVGWVVCVWVGVGGSIHFQAQLPCVLRAHMERRGCSACDCRAYGICRAHLGRAHTLAAFDQVCHQLQRLERHLALWQEEKGGGQCLVVESVCGGWQVN